MQLGPSISGRGLRSIWIETLCKFCILCDFVYCFIFQFSSLLYDLCVQQPSSNSFLLELCLSPTDKACGALFQLCLIESRGKIEGRSHIR